MVSRSEKVSLVRVESCKIKIYYEVVAKGWVTRLRRFGSEKP